MRSGNGLHPPLGEPTFLILLGLFQQPRHGWGIRRWVRQATGGRVALQGGALFDNLYRLREAGCIELVPDPEPVRTRRCRRFYALTPAGRELVRAESRRLRELCVAIQAVETEPGHEATVRAA